MVPAPGLSSAVLCLSCRERVCGTVFCLYSARLRCKTCLVPLVSFQPSEFATKRLTNKAINYYSPTLFGSLGISDVSLYTGVYGLVKGMCLSLRLKLFPTNNPSCRIHHLLRSPHRQMGTPQPNHRIFHHVLSLSLDCWRICQNRAPS